MAVRHLHWFRNDLRLNDQSKAWKNASALTFVVSNFRRRAVSEHRLRFLEESILDLQRNVAIHFPQATFEVIDQQVIDWLNPRNFDSISFELLPGTEEKVDESAVRELCSNAQIFADYSRFLIHPSDLPFSISNCPDLFTEYRKRVEQSLRVRPVGPCPVAAAPSLSGTNEWTGGETAGLARLQHYLWGSQALSTYKLTRNGMLKPDDSSKFSLWLANGNLSPRQIYAEIRKYESRFGENESTYWMIFELLWRDFFGIQALKHGAKFYLKQGLQDRPIPSDDRPDWLDAWKQGKTGFTIVDACMRQLLQTGYMSNRGRQIVASFLTKNLGLDWRLGAEHFETHLIDYDVASNWGNWLYAAGVGQDARGFRLFNVFKQATDYDPQGEFVRAFLPELAGLPLAELRQPTFESRQKVGYPSEIVDFWKSAAVNEKRYSQGSMNPGASGARHGRNHRRIRHK